MKAKAILLVLMMFVAIIPLQTSLSYAHQSGCHRWHSCPSDSGSYVCGDLGYDTYCPKQSTPSYEPPKYTTPKEKPAPIKSEPKSEAKPQPKKIEPVPMKKVYSPTCYGDALCISGKVKAIADGDTLYVDSYKVRLSLTNTPERGQTGYAEATAFMKKMCVKGSSVMVDQDDKQPYDQYGRVLGKVYCSDKNLNSELLENGLGKILTQYCKKSEFASESWAKKFGC
jgi:endonuclease YncB( thermonuclease family)